MQEPTRQGAKLVKRRPTGSPSPTRGRLSSANPYPGETPAVPPLNPSEASGSYSCVAYSTMPEDKDKKSKWRLSNPFHSKDKDKDKERKDNRDSLGDSAYASSEPNNNSRSDVNSSNIPSFSNTERRPSQPKSGEQLRPQAAALQTPATNITPPTPPTHGQNYPPPALTARQERSQENVSRETYQDSRTGNVVTTVTTTTTTTTTTTGPGGTTTVQAANTSSRDPSPQRNITNTTGPSPPSPAPPALHGNRQHQHPQQGPGPSHQTQDFTGHPPIPNRSNMRHRVELDSVSPGVEHANPLASPVSPGSPTRANFSYPARTPPPGVPRKIPSQDFAPQQSLAGQPSNPQYSQYPTQPQGQPPMHQNQLNQQQSQQQPSYGFPSGPHPAPLRPGHIPESSQNPQKPSTLANLKTAAAGIHGAGETLRGTLNNTVDKRFMKPNSAVHAKNQAAIERGRTEIETGHYVHSQRKPTANAPGPAQAPTENTPYQQRPGGTGISGSRIEPEGRSGSKLGGFIKKVKDGQVNSQRMDGRDGNLQVVNE